MNAPSTLLEATRYFTDPDVCLSFMVAIRWPDGNVTCPTCGSDNVHFIATRRLWRCNADRHSRRQFSIKVGTIMEDSPLALDKWLPAIWMITNNKNGISSYEVARALGITQKSAWFMMHRIRAAMQRGGFDKLAGEVKVDETFIGGRARFMHKDKRAAKIKGTGSMGKAAVMGLLERHGPDGHSHVRVKPVANRQKKTLVKEVKQHVEPSSRVYTDALASYNDLGATFEHQVIDHAEAPVRGQVHTNGLENFWSLLKRAIKGTYVSVEPFHLFRYLDEEAVRFNARKTTDAKRFLDVLRTIVGRRLSYRGLIGQSPTVAEA